MEVIFPHVYLPHSTCTNAELNTSQGWGITACPGSFGAVRCPLTILTEGYQRSDSRTAWKKSFSACLIKHNRWSTLVENCDAWRHHDVVSSFENIHWAAGGETSTLCYQALIWPSVAASSTVITCTPLDLSVTNVPVVGVGWRLLDLRFMKPSQEML